MKKITPFGTVPLIGAQIVLMAFNPQQSAAKTTQEIVAAAKPSVVYIKVLDDNQQELGQATGFFITESRIATNHHVVEHAGYLEMYDLNGRAFQFSKVVADDPNIDLAIVEIASTGYHSYLVFSGAPIQDGQPITVIGNPKGLEGTVSTGIVSAADRGPATFQVTAPISPGSSGSPVLNEDGYVIGMIKSQAPDGQNLNFAVRGILITDPDRYPQIPQDPPSQPRQQPFRPRQHSEPQPGSPARSAWLFPNSNSRVLSDADLAGLDCDMLWIARNEIYARNGYIFSTQRGKAYAAALGKAYQGTDANEDRVRSRMNSVERQNIERIKHFERTRNPP